ncbi:c-type heme family protein [Desulfobotulus mexicanus]|uniref:histidine kinase n=1 Tax=Desulfobotulus mexicanus TaxID=2586642 RepID=A0A5Q4VCD5_9BACT|nr:DUF3365 domain-containing protein [Desulfobotulus mexicanus]TYT75364.1 DUF3365 domain-containing protein [Desulfobotulus mexicanus]
MIQSWQVQKLPFIFTPEFHIQTMPDFSIKKRFRLGAAAIVFLFCVAAALMEYYYLRSEYFGILHQKTTLFMAMAQSSRDYVKEVLRPRMQKNSDSDFFILEAMSTSYVSREIMNRLHDHFPEFTYKRAALDPRNPANLADAFEAERIRWFHENPSQTDWSGNLKKNGHAYFVHMTPVYVEKDCLSCHGSPADAPEEMLFIYGDQASFYYQVGDVVAAETLYLPIDPTLTRIQEKAWVIFFVTALSLFSLLLLFYLLFHKTVVLNLREILNNFKKIYGPTSSVQDLFPALPQEDEANQLQQNLYLLADKLKQLHQELKTSETKYRSLFETAPEAILVSRGGRLTDINTAGLSLFGFTSMEEALDIESVYQLFWDGKHVRKIWGILQNEGCIHDMEIRIVNRRGEKRDILLSSLARPGTCAEIPDFEATLRDITEKKRMDAHLAQTDRLTSIGELAAGVAHEINNPLGVIELYASLIEKASEENEQIKQDVKVILKHSHICKKVVEALLDFSRTGPVQYKSLDMHEIIGDILQVLSREIQSRGIRVLFAPLPDFPSVTADPQQMQQLWMNLILNAIQATDAGGQIEIVSRQMGEKVVFDIKDTGKGISKSNVSRIFEPFFTTRADQKGTGLGLAIAYGIVVRHGGEISVDSIPGVGSTFTLSLPLEKE